MRSKFAVAVLLGALALAPSFTRADQGTETLEELVVESADSPADHAALANYYRGKAAEARADAKRHDHLASVYTGGKMMDRTRIQNHCKKIAADLNAVAAEYDELAKIHDAEAKKP